MGPKQPHKNRRLPRQTHPTLARCFLLRDRLLLLALSTISCVYKHLAARRIYRVESGRGVAYVGETRERLRFGYLTVEADVAAYVENTGTGDLHLTFIAIPP